MGWDASTRCQPAPATASLTVTGHHWFIFLYSHNLNISVIYAPGTGPFFRAHDIISVNENRIIVM